MKLEVEVLYNYTGVGISVNVNLCIAAPGLDIFLHNNIGKISTWPFFLNLLSPLQLGGAMQSERRLIK